MSNSNSNWRTSGQAMNTTDRRVNLALTAELALTSGPSMTYNNTMNLGGNASVVPRQRGGVGATSASDQQKDSLGAFMSKPLIQSQSNNNNSTNRQQFNNQFNQGIGSDFPSNNGFGSSTNTFSQNNNNQFKSNNNDTYSQFNNGSSQQHSQQQQYPASYRNEADSSQGFKVQRVRGGANTGNTAQSNIMALNANSNSSNFNNNFGSNNASSKEDNIDSQTWQVKKEIDSLDAKLNSKHLQQQQQQPTYQQQGPSQISGGSSYRNFYQANQETASSTTAGFNVLNNVPSFNGLNSNGFASNSSIPSQKQLQKADDMSVAAAAINASGPFQKKQSNTSKDTGVMNTQPAADSNAGLNSTKEFQTGTYDPSNILGGTRTGRMRSLGRGGKEAPSKNAHEEKAAQATGNKLLPEEMAVAEQFECPEGCGRSFNKKALEKHIPLCKKVFVPKKTDTATANHTVSNTAKTLPTKEEPKKQQAQQKLPPKAAGKKVPTGLPANKAGETAANSKNEALRKLKEQKKKEIAAAAETGSGIVGDEIKQPKKIAVNNNTNNNQDDDVIDDNQDDEGYF